MDTTQNPSSETPRPFNIVVCCNGTGNQVERDSSNVLKLFRIVHQDDDQRVFYDQGVGTIGFSSSWAPWRQKALEVLGLATAWGLDENILEAYRFVCTHYRPEARLYLFGFSRGAYTVRALAGLIHHVGLLHPDQLNLAGAALTAFKRGSEGALEEGWGFRRMARARPAPIHFLGCWDTVASVIVPWRYGPFPGLRQLPYTRTNPSVRHFRHAMAIDERRRMFRLNGWVEPQQHLPRPLAPPEERVPQDIKQVWFAGVHSDIGGGYREAESGLAKLPLAWMIDEATACGLRVRDGRRRALVDGRGSASAAGRYVAPDPSADQHDSLTWGWWPLEVIPKWAGLREWVDRRVVLGCYLPMAEPRFINPVASGSLGARLHRSVVERMKGRRDYRPINLPSTDPANLQSLFIIEP